MKWTETGSRIPQRQELKAQGLSEEEALQKIEPLDLAFNPHGVHIAPYLAGYFDGRGSIMSRVKNQNTGWLEWNIILKDDEDHLQRIQQMVGGKIGKDGPTHRLTLYGVKAVGAFLRMILPYSIIRKAEILATLEKL